MLRVEAVGICHSDVDQFRGRAPVPSGGVFPTVPGHEIVGRIEQISPDAAAEFSVQEGDRVGVRSYVLTADGKMRVYGFDFPLDEASGLFGGYADYMELVPGSEVQKLHGDRPATELTLYESLSNSATFVRSALRGESLVILGPGHMGLAAVVAARAQGVGTIVVVGLSRDRLRLDVSLRIGADQAVDLENENLLARVEEATGGRMADVMLDVASGNPVSFVTAFELMRSGGTVVAAGMKDRPLDGFDINQIPLRGITVPPGGGVDLSLACSMINDGKVPTAKLAGESFALERFENALALAERRVEGQDAVRVSLKVA